MFKAVERNKMTEKKGTCKCKGELFRKSEKLSPKKITITITPKSQD